MSDASIVRPYALTGGRTRTAGVDLPLEATVATTVAGRAVAVELAHESKVIVDLCRTPTTVVEIAAHLQVPLGVARVLVADLTETGYVTVHHHGSDPHRPDMQLLERVLDGIRSL